jgi:hypothetical protein
MIKLGFTHASRSAYIIEARSLYSFSVSEAYRRIRHSLPGQGSPERVRLLCASGLSFFMKHLFSKNKLDLKVQFCDVNFDPMVHLNLTRALTSSGAVL